MAPLTDVVISPENIALEAQREASKTLGWWQRWKIRRAIKALERELESVDIEGTYAVYEQMLDDITVLMARYTYIKDKFKESPTSELAATGKSLKEQGSTLAAKVQHPGCQMSSIKTTCGPHFGPEVSKGAARVTRDGAGL